jgi:hypothetical protein
MRVVVILDLELDGDSIRSKMNDQLQEEFLPGKFGTALAIESYIETQLVQSLERDSIGCQRNPMRVDIKEE